MSYEKPVIGANKNQQIVDLRGVMGNINNNEIGTDHRNAYLNLQ